jgi:hypothetical protein
LWTPSVGQLFNFWLWPSLRAPDISSGADYILLVEKETGKCAKPVYVSCQQYFGGVRNAFFVIDVTWLFELVSFLMFQIVTSHVLTCLPLASAPCCHGL